MAQCSISQNRVLATILALLIKAGRRDALRYVHAGWVAALTLGGCTWLVASYVITMSGLTREVETGTLQGDPVHFPGIPALGVYPNLIGLLLQAVLILISAGVFAYTHYTAKET